MNKPTEYYMALAAGVLYVILQHKEKSWWARVLIASMSGLIGYSTAHDLAEWTGRSETFAVLIVTAFSYAALDLAGALISDRQSMIEIIKSRLGSGK